MAEDEPCSQEGQCWLVSEIVCGSLAVLGTGEATPKVLHPVLDLHFKKDIEVLE